MLSPSVIKDSLKLLFRRLLLGLELLFRLRLGLWLSLVCLRIACHGERYNVAKSLLPLIEWIVDMDSGCSLWMIPLRGMIEDRSDVEC